MKASVAFLAAGFGTRFGGGIKQIEPVGPNGEVLMDYAVHDALAAGFSRAIFIIRRDIEKEFRAGVGRRVEKKCDVEYVYQDITDLPSGFSVPTGRQNPWGTGQAVWACRDVIREPFCVLNADDYYGSQAFREIYAYLSGKRESGNKLDLCMAGYVLGNTLSESGPVTRGICRMNENRKLVELKETKGIVLREGVPCVETDGRIEKLDPESLVSMNIWGLQPEFIAYLEDHFAPFLQSIGENACKAEYLLPIIIGDMVRSGEGTVQVLPAADRWFGMTYAADKLQAQRKIRELIAAGVYPEKM